MLRKKVGLKKLEEYCRPWCFMILFVLYVGFGWNE
jgi:hypothetical protein